MVNYDVNVKLKPDSKELDRELRKKRGIGTSSGGQGRSGFGNVASFLGMEATLDQINSTSNSTKEHSKSSASGIFKLIGVASVIGVALSALTDLLRPFVDLFRATFTLLFYPLVLKLIPLLDKWSNWLGESAKEGGGVIGSIKGSKNMLEKSFGTPGTSIWEDIKRVLIAGLTAVIASIAILLIAILSPLTIPIMAIIAGIAALGTLLVLAWDDHLKPAIMSLVEKWRGIWDTIKERWTLLINAGKWVWDNIIKPGFDFLKDAGSMVWDIIKTPFIWLAEKIRGIWDFFKNLNPFGGGSGESSTSVNDAIISPSGKVITTHPRDYLIATKNPGSLSGGGSGFNFSPTIQIMGGLGGTDERKMAERIVEIAAREFSRRSGGFKY